MINDDKTCPYGHTCTECKMYVPFPVSTGDGVVREEMECAILWQTMMLRDIAKFVDQIGVVSDQTRNEVAKLTAIAGGQVLNRIDNG